jgi:hypothetical protein
VEEHAAVASSVARRTSVQVLARLVKYELFRRVPPGGLPATPLPAPPRPVDPGVAAAADADADADASRPPRSSPPSFNAFAMHTAPFVPTTSAIGAKMLPMNDADPTPVLDALEPYVRADGRAAVLLACGCELFAVRDALRTCPFEVCAGVYTASAARALALIAHAWHAHGVPTAHAADGWRAVTKLMETLKDMCCEDSVRLTSPGLPRRGRGGVDGVDAGLSTAVCGLRAGLAGPWGRRLGEALPALTRKLIESGAPQPAVNKFAYNATLLAWVVASDQTPRASPNCVGISNFTYNPPIHAMRSNLGESPYGDAEYDYGFTTLPPRSETSGEALSKRDEFFLQEGLLAPPAALGLRASSIKEMHEVLKDVTVWARDCVCARLTKPSDPVNIWNKELFTALAAAQDFVKMAEQEAMRSRSVATLVCVTMLLKQVNERRGKERARNLGGCLKDCDPESELHDYDDRLRDGVRFEVLRTLESHDAIFIPGRRAGELPTFGLWETPGTTEDATQPIKIATSFPTIRWGIRDGDSDRPTARIIDVNPTVSVWSIVEEYGSNGDSAYHLYARASPVAAAMHHVLNAIAAAVEHIKTAAWISTGSSSYGDAAAHDAVRTALTAGGASSSSSPLRSLIVAFGVIHAAAVALRVAAPPVDVPEDVVSAYPAKEVRSIQYLGHHDVDPDRKFYFGNEARSISHWFPYDRVGVVNADP